DVFTMRSRTLSKNFGSITHQYTWEQGRRLGASGLAVTEVMPDFRTERDPLGELQVPSTAYYGVQTARAVENFAISGLRAPADLVTATILIKKAAAEANAQLGRIDREVAGAIVRAADEILGGALRDQFVV